MDRAQLTAALEYHLVNSLGWAALRPLQQAAISPIRHGEDCLLVAPTAGGKTEAALMPLLSNLVDDGWRGLSVLYITPLRALLNNLHPRISGYTGWLGRIAGLWHGDTTQSQRQRMLTEPPDVLLTTPESLEAMLVSTRVDHHQLFGSLRAVVVDELHAFAGDDRGWHLLAVLQRLERIAGGHIQRIGLSATVGNPDSVATWLQGGTASATPRVVTGGAEGTAAAPQVSVDYVGSVSNAATVLAQLHRGQKRLVFCEARSKAEDLAHELRSREVTVFVSHSSLSREERRLSEQAFAEASDCVIVATSTLELGIDVGDLDVVVQLDAPYRVSSFLQRLGRSGRRPGTRSNMLFLATDAAALLRAAGLLLLWSRDHVEPVVPPPAPRHIAAQQFLALALQESQISPKHWREWFGDLEVMADGELVLGHLRSAGFLEEDGGLCFIGPEAERNFGRRHFMDLLAAFTAAPEMRVVAGRDEIGTISPLALARTPDARGPRALPLAGKLWKVESVHWDRHEVLVSAHPEGEAGRIRWPGEPTAASYELCRAQREALLGAAPPVTLSQRARTHLERVRADLGGTVDESGLVLAHDNGQSTLWTWAGQHANDTLAAALNEPDGVSSDNVSIRLPRGLRVEDLRTAAAQVETALPFVTEEAVDGLKFSAALPRDLARATLAERNVDRPHAQKVIESRIVVR